MNKPLAANLAMLSGVLLIVTGVVAILLTGMDIVYGGLGAIVAASGAALTFWGRRTSPEPTSSLQGGPERSSQKPINSSSHTKLDRRL